MSNSWSTSNQPEFVPGLGRREMGSQHPSPNMKNLRTFEPQIWLEIITSRDAKSTCFQGSQTSCTEIISVFFFFAKICPKKITSRDGCVLLKKQYEIASTRFVHRVAQKLVNSWSIPRQLPISWEVAGVLLAIVLWQHPKTSQEVPRWEVKFPENSHPTDRL